MDQLDTGDILLFKGSPKSIISKVTDSPYTHAAIVVKDPWWGNLKKGLYVIQSLDSKPDYKDVETNTYRSGVQMEKLKVAIGDRDVDIRHIFGVKRNNKFKKLFKRIHMDTFLKPYDKKCIDWFTVGVSNLFCKNCKVLRHSNNFWCSALVGYFYTKLGWLPSYTDWSNLSPGDLANIRTNPPFMLGRITPLKVGKMYTLF